MNNASFNQRAITAAIPLVLVWNKKAEAEYKK